MRHTSKNFHPTKKMIKRAEKKIWHFEDALITVKARYLSDDRLERLKNLQLQSHLLVACCRKQANKLYSHLREPATIRKCGLLQKRKKAQRGGSRGQRKNFFQIKKRRRGNRKSVRKQVFHFAASVFVLLSGLNFSNLKLKLIAFSVLSLLMQLS